MSLATAWLQLLDQFNGECSLALCMDSIWCTCMFILYSVVNHLTDHKFAFRVLEGTIFCLMRRRNDLKGKGLLSPRTHDMNELGYFY